MPDIDQLTSDLQEFLDTSPTAYHAVDGLANRLLAAGARELAIDEPWPDAPRLGFVRRGGALHAWRLPQAWSLRDKKNLSGDDFLSIAIELENLIHLTEQAEVLVKRLSKLRDRKSVV